MHYFEMSENIGDVERIFRILSGAALLGVTLLGPASFLYTTLFPMLAAYFVLTAIMRWDPIGYAIQIALRIMASVTSTSSHSIKHTKTKKKGQSVTAKSCLGLGAARPL